LSGSNSSIGNGYYRYTTFTVGWGEGSVEANSTSYTHGTSFKIEIDENGGGGVSDINYTTSTSSQSKTLPTVTRDGWTFSSWEIVTNSSGRDSSLSGSTVTVAALAYGNIKVRAKWTPRIYNVYYDVDGGTSISSFTYTVSESYQNKALAENATKTGHKFKGWTIKTNSSGSNSSISTSAMFTLYIPAGAYGDITVKATYNENPYKIKVYSYNETLLTTINATFNTWATMPTPATITGMKFKGWRFYATGSHSYAYGTDDTSTSGSAISLNSTTTQKYNYFKQLTSEPDYIVSMYAQYEYITYKLSYALADGAQATTPPATATYNSAFNVVHPTKTGYTFTGWTISDMSNSEHIFDYSYVTGTSASSVKATRFMNLHTTQDSTVTFTATWSKNTYTVLYETAVDEKGNITTSEKTVNYGDWVNVAIPTRLGYSASSITIKGMDSTTHYYNTTNSDTGAQNFTDKSKTGIGVSNVYYKNLRATSGRVVVSIVWTANTYKIKYTLNNGTGGSPAPTTATYNTPFTVAYPTRTGYNFVKWSISGMDTNKHYVDGELFETATRDVKKVYTTGATGNEYLNLHATKDNEVTFTANWEVAKYNVYYHYINSNQYSEINIPDKYTHVSQNVTNYSGSITDFADRKYENVATYGNAYTLKAAPDAKFIPAGTSFTGWKVSTTALTGTTAITKSHDAGASYTNSWNHTGTLYVYAVYSKNTYTINVYGPKSSVTDFYKTNKVNNTSYYEKRDTKTLKAGEVLSASYAVSGYTLAGYYYSTSAVSSGTVLSSSSILNGSKWENFTATTCYVYAYYVPTEYSIHYYTTFDSSVDTDANGDITKYHALQTEYFTYQAENSVLFNGTIQLVRLSDKRQTATWPEQRTTPVGYEFVGWWLFSEPKSNLKLADLSAENSEDWEKQSGALNVEDYSYLGAVSCTMPLPYGHQTFRFDMVINKWMMNHDVYAYACYTPRAFTVYYTFPGYNPDNKSLYPYESVTDIATNAFPTKLRNHFGLAAGADIEPYLNADIYKEFCLNQIDDEDGYEIYNESITRRYQFRKEFTSLTENDVYNITGHKLYGANILGWIVDEDSLSQDDM
ncbi:MAG: InlB B-repeat-containing protein, partial [Clostridia bacterium]|nr:InlB B-repeat-containing protein [Clostridia bacterium]